MKSYFVSLYKLELHFRFGVKMALYTEFMKIIFFCFAILVYSKNILSYVKVMIKKEYIVPRF